MIFKKSKMSKKQQKFVQDVIDGNNSDIVEIAMFLQQNKKLDVDEQTYNAFQDAVHKIQNISSDEHKKQKYHKYIDGFKKIDNGFEKEFIVVGVGYDNRQEIIENVKKRKPLSINMTTFKGNPAIEVLFENQIIGYIAREDVESVLDVKEYITHIEVERTYTNTKGEKGLFVKIVVSSKTFD